MKTSSKTLKLTTTPQDINPYEEDLIKGLAVDLVIFGFHEGQLKILLLKHTNTRFFALPGGYIGKNENLNDAAKRVLKARTGLSDIYLEQFYVFGDVFRNDPAVIEKIMVARGFPPTEGHWIMDRTLSVGFYALVDFTLAIPTPDDFSDSCEWYDLKNLPQLMLDHGAMVERALRTLQNDLDRKLIGFNLLPDTFTMIDLQSVYETVLDTTLIRTNFQRKMLSLDILDRVEKKFTGGAHKAPYLYRFKHSISKK